METASLSWRRRNLYCRLFYDDSWASQVRFISPIFLLFPIGIQFLQRKSDTIKQSFKKSFPLRPVLLVVIIHDFLFLSVIPVKYLGFTQLWFYTTLKPKKGLIRKKLRFTQLWFYTTLKRRLTRDPEVRVSLNYDFTLLSNSLSSITLNTFVSLNYDFTLLSNWRTD